MRMAAGVKYLNVRHRGAVPRMRLILILAALNALAILLAAMPAAAQPTGMANDLEYLAFMQNLQRARAVACGAEGAAVADALQKKGIRADVQGSKRTTRAQGSLLASGSSSRRRSHRSL
jgi:hypothetical protein